MSASKSYNLQRDYIFEPKAFGELKNAEAIVLAYDGVNPMPPTLCYLKPFYPAWNDELSAELVRQFALPMDRRLAHLSRGMRMKAALASSLRRTTKLPNLWALF